MNETYLFLIGVFVTALVTAAVTLVIWGGQEDQIFEDRRRQELESANTRRKQELAPPVQVRRFKVRNDAPLESESVSA